MGQLRITNQNWLDANLLSMAGSIYPLVYVHYGGLLRAHRHCLCPNGRKTPSAYLPPISCPSYPPIFLYATPMILRGCKTLSQKPAVNTAQQI